jgi:hypothetical protein
VRHVGRRDFSRSVDANVDVECCCLMTCRNVSCLISTTCGRLPTLEPSRLYGYGTTRDWPQASVCARWHASTWIHPLLSVRKCVLPIDIVLPQGMDIMLRQGAVGDEIITSPWRVCDHSKNLSKKVS